MKKKLKPKWNNYIVNVQISNTKLLCGCKEHSLGDKRIHSCIMGSGEHLNINTWKIEEQAAGSLQGPCIYISVINLSKAKGGNTWPDTKEDQAD